MVIMSDRGLPHSHGTWDEKLTCGETSLSKVLHRVLQRQPQPRLLGPAGHHLADDVERQVEHGRHVAEPRGEEGRGVRVGR